jgi:hypothetical protein
MFPIRRATRGIDSSQHKAKNTGKGNIKSCFTGVSFFLLMLLVFSRLAR